MADTRIAIYPGTFDPITCGHVDIITRALKVVDKLVIGIAVDNVKRPIFSLDQRVDMVQNDIYTWPEDIQKRVIVKGFSGLLVNFARFEKATLIVRGLRAVSDFEYEFQMSCMNSKLDHGIETIFLPASEKTHFIASRLVKEIARLNGDITEFVSPYVGNKLRNHFASLTKA